MNGVSDIAVLKDRVDRHRADLKRVFTRVEGVEEARTQNALDRVRDQSKFDEMSAQLESLRNTVEDAVEGIEKVDNSIDEKLSKIVSTVSKTQEQIGSIDNRLTVIEANRFDIVKVFRWLGTWRGTFFMCFVFSITVGVLVPDAREFILDVLGIATKAKG